MCHICNSKTRRLDHPGNQITWCLDKVKWVVTQKDIENHVSSFESKAWLKKGEGANYLKPYLDKRVGNYRKVEIAPYNKQAFIDDLILINKILKVMKPEHPSELVSTLKYLSEGYNLREQIDKLNLPEGSEDLEISKELKKITSKGNWFTRLFK